MKKYFTILLVYCLFICSSCSSKIINVCSDELNIDLSKFKVISKYNDYGFSLNGDGSAFLVFDCKNSAVADDIKSKKSWMKFPLNKEAAYFAYNFDSEEKNIPEIKKGYYILIDRQEEDKENIIERKSFNFTLSIYDSDNDLLYLWRLDT